MLAFLHIPKTGGTSLRAALISGGVRVLSIDSVEQARAFADLPPEERAAWPAVFGHMAAGIHTVVDLPVRYATFLREPVSRLVSAYLHVARTPEHPRHAEVLAGLTFERYALETAFTDNTMARRLGAYDWTVGEWWLDLPSGSLWDHHLRIALQTLAACEFVGDFAHFSEDVRRFGAAFGCAIGDDLPRLNGADQDLPVSAALRSRIEQRNVVDCELYETGRAAACGR